MKTEELKKELNYTELEDRLEMAQAAARDVYRCGSGNGNETPSTK
jgi:hypothetical protein